MSVTGCSLLLVDDDPLVLSSLAALLARDFEVVTAAGGDEARAVLAARPVDLVLTDHIMPDATGVELLEWVRGQSPGTARLLMTGAAHAVDTLDAVNRAGAGGVFLKPFRYDALRQALRDLAGQVRQGRERDDELARLRRQADELRQANRDLERRGHELAALALTDPLTGLPNRRAVEDAARVEVLRRVRYPAPLALGLVDVDGFHAVNARHTLAGGDQLLVRLAALLSAGLRRVDRLGRVGGDEFLVVAPATGAEGAGALGERLRAAAERDLGATISLGFAAAAAGVAASLESLWESAARALQEAKAGGRNRVVVRDVPPTLVPGGQDAGQDAGGPDPGLQAASR